MYLLMLEVQSGKNGKFRCQILNKRSSIYHQNY